MKKTAFCILIFFTLLFVACGKKPQTWQELYDLGEKYLLEENYEEAIVAFSSAIELEPKEAIIYIGRGDAYAAYQALENYLEMALADYKQALELDESILDAYLGMADVYVQQGDYEQALEILQKGQEVTGAQEITEQISVIEEQIPENMTEELDEISDEAENTETNTDEIIFENEELTVTKLGDRSGTVTLKGLSIKDSYSEMDMDGQDFWLWTVDVYMDNGFYIQFMTDCENALVWEEKATCTIEETTQVFRCGSRNSGTESYKEQISMNYTMDSITWSFMIPEDIDFDFSKITECTVFNMVFEDSYGGRKYDANGNLTEIF